LETKLLTFPENSNIIFTREANMRGNYVTERW